MEDQILPHPLAGIALKPWAFEQIMRMKEQFDPVANSIGAACPWASDKHPTLVRLVIDNEFPVLDLFGPYEVKGIRYRLEMREW